MSRHRRGRITVQSQPTGAARAMQRGMGAVHAVFGVVFVIIAVTQIMPMNFLFSLPFLAGGLFFAVNGIRLAIGKNGLAHRVGYDVETDVEGETIAGLMDDVDQMAREEAERPAKEREVSFDAKARMEQLETLKSSGLITEAEYQAKRREILREL
ncbi:MAG: SHOCT domain-containing protein [Oscillospiraceae bacterium]